MCTQLLYKIGLIFDATLNKNCVVYLEKNNLEFIKILFVKSLGAMGTRIPKFTNCACFYGEIDAFNNRKVFLLTKCD